MTDTIALEALKGCPFCDEGVAVLANNSDLSGYVDAYWVSCVSCDAEGPCASDAAEAIAAWNRRPPPKVDTPDEVREALEPFALVAERDIGEDESDNDLFRSSPEQYARAPRITVGHMRAALAALSTPARTFDEGVAWMREEAAKVADECAEMLAAFDHAAAKDKIDFGHGIASAIRSHTGEASQGVGDSGEVGAITPCGGCGATEDSQRCMGCLHDFGTPESAWVKKYALSPNGREASK